MKYTDPTGHADQVTGGWQFTITVQDWDEKIKPQLLQLLKQYEDSAWWEEAILTGIVGFPVGGLAAKAGAPVAKQFLLALGASVTVDFLGNLITTPGDINARELRQVIDRIDKLVNDVRNTANQFVTVTSPQYLDYYWSFSGARVNPAVGWKVQDILGRYSVNTVPIRP